MIIVVSSEEKLVSSPVDGRFGRCSYFAIHDTKAGTWDFKENKGLEANHGAGIGAAQFVVDLKADVVLTGNLGQKALDVLQATKIKGYQVKNGTIEEALKMYEDDKLALITMPGRPQK